MILTVTAPKKGLGQTITAINLAASCNSVIKKNVLLVDTNKYCSDIEYFLSDTTTTKGLDEFIGLYDAGILNEGSFNSCVKTVKKGIDIMAANDYLELNNRVVESLINFSSKIYGITIIDSIGGNNNCSRLFFQQSDLILVVINQSKKIVEMVAQNSIYREFGEKVVFILNRHMNTYEDKKVQYTIQEIEADLKNTGFDNPLFPLAYDVDILNECNDHSVLNIVFNKRAAGFLYNRQLQELVKHVGGTICEDKPEAKLFNSINGRKSKLFGLI